MDEQFTPRENREYPSERFESFRPLGHVRHFKILVAVHIQKHLTGKIGFVDIRRGNDLLSQLYFLNIQISHSISSFDRITQEKKRNGIPFLFISLVESFLLVVSLGVKCRLLRISGPPQRPRVCSHRRAWL